MKTIQRLFLMSCLVACMAESADSDYLIVSRSATLKAEPLRYAETLEPISQGDRLELLDSNQTSGYYFARHASGSEGYVYRTLVRRYREGASVGASTSTNGPTTGTETSSPSTTSTGPEYRPQQLTSAFFGDRNTHFYAHFISVDQGSAAILEFPCGAILIDAGYYRSQYKAALLDYIEEFFGNRTDLNNTFDAVFITHNHLDHTGALREICSNYTVRNYIDNGDKDTGNQKLIRQDFASRGDATVVKGTKWSDVTASGNRQGLTSSVIDPVDCSVHDPEIRLLSGSLTAAPAGWSSVSFTNPNNNSLVVRVDYGEASLLITGDLEDVAIEHLLDYYQSTSMLDVDVYVAGHHGSVNGTTESLVAAMTPGLVVMSFGDPRYERTGRSAYGYGHPNVMTVQLFEAKLAGNRMPSITETAFNGGSTPQSVRIDRPIFGTGWDGNVVLKFGYDGGVSVATSRSAGPS